MKKGFTLIELLVVIAIIGLISSLVLVSFSGQRQKAKIAKTLEFNQSLHNALGSEAVGVWDFDEGSGTVARDGSGYGNDGIINGATYDCFDTPYHEIGQGGDRCALNFSGGNYYVCLDDGAGACTSSVSFNFSNTPFTVSAWVKAMGGGSEPQVVSSYNQWELSCWPTSCRMLLGRAGGGFDTVNAGITRNTWNHVVGVRDPQGSGLLELYVNGERVVSTPSTALLVGSGARQVNIGSRPDLNPAAFYSGLIDEVRIYSRALTLGEIQQLYVEGLPHHQSVALNPKP